MYWNEIIQWFNDVISNINYARIGLQVEVRDPFKKAETEHELSKRGIRYCKGFYSFNRATVYGITGGRKKDITDFANWYLAVEKEPKYYISNHKWFGTKICNIIRD